MIADIPAVLYLFLSAALFTIGVAGVLIRRNLIVVLMSIELILNAANINLVYFSRHWDSGNGEAFAVFILAVAAVEAIVGLGIVLALRREHKKPLAEEMDLLKW